MAKRVDVKQVEALLAEGAQLVEVLPADEYAEQHLPGAINIPLKELDASTVAVLDRARPVIVYCWDSVCDLSPRAACRLETLGFEQVYDYVAGKYDWLAYGLPTEGEDARKRTAADLASAEVVTCALQDPAAPLRERVEASPFPFALVLSRTNVLLGRIPKSALADGVDAAAEAVMESGPSTFRPNVHLDALVERLRKRDFKYAIVTRADGTLVGVARREDAERHLEG
jgi:rhodanese-related sulfurtransferase